MISQIPALQTNVIATVRREPTAVGQPAGFESSTAQSQGNAFRLQDTTVLEAKPNNNDNFAAHSIHLAEVSNVSNMGVSRDAVSQAQLAYVTAANLTAARPYQSVSFSV